VEDYFLAILALETYNGVVKKVILQVPERSHFGGIGRTPLKTYCSAARLQSRIGLLLFSKKIERNPACLDVRDSNVHSTS